MSNGRVKRPGHVGLSTNEHRDTADSLLVTVLALRGLLALLQSRYVRSHPAVRQCKAAVTEVQSLRITLANQIAVEHRAAGIDYLATTTIEEPQEHI